MRTEPSAIETALSKALEVVKGASQPIEISVNAQDFTIVSWPKMSRTTPQSFSALSLRDELPLIGTIAGLSSAYASEHAGNMLRAP